MIIKMDLGTFYVDIVWNLCQQEDLETTNLQLINVVAFVVSLHATSIGSAKTDPTLLNYIY
jgi:hypothetical protein